MAGLSQSFLADAEEAFDTDDAVDDAAGEGGTVFFGLLSYWFGSGFGVEDREGFTEEIEELLNGEMEDVGFGVSIHDISFVSISECKGNYLNIKKIGITMMVTVTPYVMSGEVTDYGLLPVMVWKKSRMCRMFLAILCGGLLLNSE